MFACLFGVFFRACVCDRPSCLLFVFFTSVLVCLFVCLFVHKTFSLQPFSCGPLMACLSIMVWVWLVLKAYLFDRGADRAGPRMCV